MPMPDYQSCILPLLLVAGDSAEHSLRDATEKLAIEFKLTEEERMELLPSGQSLLFSNRVAWARSYLKKAGLLDSPRRGAIIITARGKQCLAEKPARIDVKYLERFPEFVEFRTASRSGNEQDTQRIELPSEKTPEEQLELAHQTLQSALAQDLIAYRINGIPR